MDQRILRNIVGAIIIFGHIGLLVYVVVRLGDFMGPDQQTRILLSLGPVAGTYFAAVVKTAIRERYETPEARRVSFEFSYICITLFIFFTGALFYLCISFPSGIAEDTDALAKWIAGIEVALGGTLGLVVDALFPSTASTSSAQPKGKSTKSAANK